MTSTNAASETFQAVQWRGEHLVLLDQRRLPGEEAYLDITDVEAAAQAIRDMVVRGAPAIGITAAYEVVLAVRQRRIGDLDRLILARPTTVNLAWAVQRMRQVMETTADTDLEATSAGRGTVYPRGGPAGQSPYR